MVQAANYKHLINLCLTKNSSGKAYSLICKFANIRVNCDRYFPLWIDFIVPNI